MSAAVRLLRQRVVGETVAEESLYGGFSTPYTGTDVSGLAGTYDLDLRYVPAEKADEVGGVTFREALKKQAGLTLVERKQPVQVIVLDHLERPTPN